MASSIVHLATYCCSDVVGCVHDNKPFDLFQEESTACHDEASEWNAKSVEDDQGDEAGNGAVLIVFFEEV